MKHAQHAAHNPKIRKDGIIQTSPVVVLEKIKDPPMWLLKVTTTLEKDSNPPLSPLFIHALQNNYQADLKNSHQTLSVDII